LALSCRGSQAKVSPPVLVLAGTPRAPTTTALPCPAPVDRPHGAPSDPPFPPLIPPDGQDDSRGAGVASTSDVSLAAL
jgi:hypothetical protein